MVESVARRQVPVEGDNSHPAPSTHKTAKLVSCLKLYVASRLEDRDKNHLGNQ